MAIEVFGAGAVQSAYVSYLPLNITTNSITLLWPTSYVNAPYIDSSVNPAIHYNILAASMDVTTADPNVYTITLPNATMSSVGSNFIITNVGLRPFNLLRFDSTVLQTIAIPSLLPPHSNSYWIQLTDNSTAAGVWTVITFGAGKSEASAASLVGNGLTVIDATLNTDTPIVQRNAPTVIDETFRAKLILWTGGAATLPLPAIGSVPAGYYVSFNNQSSSQITIAPGELVTTIDGKLTLAVESQQSLTIISDGANWWTLGFGQNQFAVTSSLYLPVAGAANVILSNIQASSLIQNYTGDLTGDITVFFPLTTNYWFINNLTIGAFTLSVQLVGGVGTSYVVPQGTSQVFYSSEDPITGFSLLPIPTGLSLASGSSTSPAVAFLSNPGTGVYSNAPGNILGFSVNGVHTGHFQTLNPVSSLYLPSFNQAVSLVLNISNVNARLTYNVIDAITIDPAGVTTLSSPLPLGSGGTGATAQPAAANAILPPAVEESILVFRGGTWVSIGPGAEGSFLKISGGLVAWV